IDFSASIFALGITYFWVSRSLTRPIARLDAGMRKVAAGNLEQRLPVTSNEEIGQLTSHFNDMVEGLRERRRIRETFGKYVSESVASALLKDAEGGRLAAETREATLVFTDIEGFTPLAEDLPPDVLIGVLNEYLELVMAPIQAAGGVINNFVGDGLFASFNLPLADPDHAAHAVAAALGIRAALEGRLFAGRVRLKTRIGINTGLVVGGTVGAGDRLSYTLLGDAVNTAARLQELAKTQGTDILVAEATRARAGEAFRFRSLGEVAIRGRIGAMTIFTVDGPTKE
ncbi:MAG: adenylate/guanylate cyclase domain-containing protein, partial [Alphaproteobacteria bacterium]|nr:adenylate/guanylate cyclase domain-containing protein [Alphaproteobacteria bacterium]